MNNRDYDFLLSVLRAFQNDPEIAGFRFRASPLKTVFVIERFGADGGDDPERENPNPPDGKTVHYLSVGETGRKIER